MSINVFKVYLIYIMGMNLIYSHGEMALLIQVLCLSDPYNW